MHDRSKFSDNLIRIRKQKGLSQADLAKISGISARMIGHYEKHVSHPSINKITIIAKALGIPSSELIELDNENVSHDDFEELKNVNAQTLKQFKKILQLNYNDRSTVYKVIDSLLNKKQSKSKAH